MHFPLNSPPREMTPVTGSIPGTFSETAPVFFLFAHFLFPYAKTISMGLKKELQEEGLLFSSSYFLEYLVNKDIVFYDVFVIELIMSFIRILLGFVRSDVSNNFL